MGTTRKVNIMVDVSEEVYDTIVEPYKRNKKFSKLIETLLLGCMENDGVAEYVEGKFSSYYKQANHAFNGAVGSMMSSLAMVGIMADTASEMMEDGKRAVKLDDGVKVINGPSPEKPEDGKLEKEIKELRRENQDTREKLQEVTEILRKFMNGEFNSKKEEEMAAEKEVAVSAVKEESTEETAKEEAREVGTEKTVDLRGNTVFDGVEKSAEKKVEKRAEKRVDPKAPEVKVKPMPEDDDLDEDDPLFAPVSFEDEDSGDDEINLFEEDKEDEDSYLDNLLNGQVYTV